MYKNFKEYLVESEKVKKRILAEMPYVNISKDDPDVIFDFEFESYRTPSEFLKKLKNIFDGKVHSDKYGNEIGPVKTQAQRDEIVRQILADDLGMVYSVAKTKWKLKKEEFSLLLSQFIKTFD